MGKLFDIIDYSKNITDLLPLIKKFIKQSSKKNTCAVFDVDDTLFTTRNDEYISVNKAGKYLFDLVQLYNIPIILVTARQGSPASATYCKKQLRLAGYKDFEALYMQPKSSRDSSFYKFQIRQKLIEQYGSILLNVGDQRSDIFNLKDLPDVDVDIIYKTFSNTTNYVILVPDDAQLSILFVDGPPESAEMSDN